MSEECKSITVYPRYDEEAMEVNDLSRDHNRKDSLLTNLGLSVLKRSESIRASETNVSQKNLQTPVVSQQLGGDELIKEKLRLIGMFSKDEEELLDDIPLSYCMKKIINRNNLYQELLDDRNARFWYSIYYIKNGI